MTEAERFNEWRAAHYPTASRIHTQMMYAAWTAALGAPKPAPKRADHKKSKPKAAPKADEAAD